MASWPVTTARTEIVPLRSHAMSVALALLVISVFVNYVDRGALAEGRARHFSVTAWHSAFLVLLDIHSIPLPLRLVR